MENWHGNDAFSILALSIKENYFVFIATLVLQFQIWIKSADFPTLNSFSEILVLKNKNAFWVSKLDKSQNYWVLINVFWIGLRFVRYRS